MSKDFPLLPKNQEEYCSLLPSIVRSLGIETNELTPEQRITMFNSSMGNLSSSLSKISDTDFAIQEIEPVEIRDKIVKAFATINSNTRKGKREYNEMYISNPNEVMGVFAYSIDYTEKIGNPVEFLNRNTVGEHEKGYGDAEDLSVRERTEFLRKYALERNLPFIIFGD